MGHLDCPDRAVSQAKANQKVIHKSVSFAKRNMSTVLLVQLSQLLGAVVLYLIFYVTYIYGLKYREKTDIEYSSDTWFLLFKCHVK